eukprot:403372240
MTWRDPQIRLKSCTPPLYPHPPWINQRNLSWAGQTYANQNMMMKLTLVAEEQIQHQITIKINDTTSQNYSLNDKHFDDCEDYCEDDDSAIFDDDYIPLVKITQAPPFVEEEQKSSFFHKMHTFNSNSDQQQEQNGFKVTLQIPEININPPLQRSRTGNQDKRTFISTPRNQQELPQLSSFNKNNLFAFSNDSQLAQLFCDSSESLPLNGQTGSNHDNDKRSSQQLSVENQFMNKSNFLSIPEAAGTNRQQQDTSDSFYRQNSHNSKLSSASIIKSIDEEGVGDSDDSFTSINTDIQKTIINEQQAQYGRQGTYKQRKNEESSLFQININTCNETGKANLNVPQPSNFTRSLTSQTQYKIKNEQQQIDRQDKNIDEESLYTEEDYVESLSREETYGNIQKDYQYNRSQTLREKCNYSINILTSRDDDIPSDPNYLSPLKNQNTCQHLSKVMGWITSLTTKFLHSLKNNDVSFTSTKYELNIKCSFIVTCYNTANLLFADTIVLPTVVILETVTNAIHLHQSITAANFYPVRQLNPYQLNQNFNTYERQKSNASSNTTDSHTSKNSKSSINKNLAMLNQIYKGIADEDEKLQFILTNASLFAKDQNGCRRIQKKLDQQINTPSGAKFSEDLLNSLIDSFDDLIQHSFANYLCQKLIKTAQDYQVDKILLKLCLDIHGNHVIQICLDCFANEQFSQPIYQTVLQNCSRIATDKHGCCVVQKLLCTSKFCIQSELVKKSLEQIDSLINDQYGNYVIQQVLKFNDYLINIQICSYICTKFDYFCTQKISSNVVETAIRITSNECKRVFFNFLHKNVGVFKGLMMDQFGNYVIQAVLQMSCDFQDQTYYDFFYKIFIENQEQLRKVNFGKKFIQKIMTLEPPSQQTSTGQIQRQILQKGGQQRHNTFKSAPQQNNQVRINKEEQKYMPKDQMIYKKNTK